MQFTMPTENHMLDFFDENYRLGAEFGGALGVVVALVAMEIVRRRTKEAAFGAYSRGVTLVVLLLESTFAAMTIVGPSLSSSMPQIAIRSTGFAIWFGICGNVMILVLSTFEAMRRSIKQAGKLKRHL
jgi:hypothetical protein